MPSQGPYADSLTEVLREGARALLARAVEAEVADFLARHADCTTEDGRWRIVRHGHLPERSIMTGIGPVTVRQPRVRDRAGDAGEHIRFSPNIYLEARLEDQAQCILVIIGATPEGKKELVGRI